MANGNDFRGGGSPWGSPPCGSGNGSFRKGPTPPNIDEIIKTDKINFIIPYSLTESFPEQLPGVWRLQNDVVLL